MLRELKKCLSVSLNVVSNSCFKILASFSYVNIILSVLRYPIYTISHRCSDIKYFLNNYLYFFGGLKYENYLFAFV